MKRFFIAPILAILLPLACTQNLNLRDIPKSTTTIEKFDIDSVSFRDITLLFDVGINNPYHLTIKFDKVTFNFLIDKKQLFQTATTRALRITPRNKTTTPLLVNLKYQDIMNIVKDYGRRDYLDCAVEGEILLAIPKTGVQGIPDSLKFPFTLKKRVPAIKPEIAIRNFAIQKPSLDEIKKALQKSKKNLEPESVMKMFGDVISGKKKAAEALKPEDLDVKLTVSFDIELLNSTAAALDFENMNYDFFVNSSRLVTGTSTNVRRAGMKTVVSIVNSFSSRSLAKSVQDALYSGKGAFGLKGHTFLRLPPSIKKDLLKLTFDESGNFSL